MAPEAVRYGHEYLARSAEVGSMMKVVGEEGTSLDDYIVYQKGEFLDAVYLQQNSFDPVDSSVSPERQKRPRERRTYQFESASTKSVIFPVAV